MRFGNITPNYPLEPITTGPLPILFPTSNNLVPKLGAFSASAFFSMNTLSWILLLFIYDSVLSPKFVIQDPGKYLPWTLTFQIECEFV